MLIPVRHKLVLTIDSCGTDFLELGGMEQWREQRIGVDSRIYNGPRRGWTYTGRVAVVAK